MGKNKALIINLLATILSFTVNLGINLLLTPYLTKTLGVEAYGFISLGTNLINYISLITIALNSMASRFITIEIHKENWILANQYFNSVLIGNVVAAIGLSLPVTLIIINIEKVINIPLHLIGDVKLLFMFLFINYLISIIFSTFGVATFATNKLYLKSLREIEGLILKSLILLLLIILVKPSVSIIGISGLAMISYTSLFNFYYTKKLLPAIQIKKLYFKIKLVIELFLSGIWNTVVQIGQIFLQGMDLIIANLFLNATSMGIIAISKTVPMAIISLVGVISNVFLPSLTEFYAKEDQENLLKTISRSMNLLGLVTNISVAALVIFGKDFFALWVPTEDPLTLQMLSIITIIYIVIGGPVNIVYGIFTVTNKLKVNALVVLVTGFFNVGIVFLLLKMTNGGMYVIVGVSTFIGMFRDLVFAIPYSAYCINIKKWFFYQKVLKSIVSFILTISVGSFLHRYLIINGWGSLFISAVIFVFFAGIINSLILFYAEWKYLYFKFKK